MNKIVITLAALVACVSLRAQEPASSYSVTVDFPYTSKYVFRGIELARDSFQPSVEVASGNWYAGLWTNQPIVDNTDNEIDFYAGYGIPLSDSWSLDTGVTYYFYPEGDDSAGIEDTTEFFAGLTGTLAGFSPSFYTYYDIDLKAWTFQGSVGYSAPLSDKASLDFSATVGRVDTDGGTDYTYYGVGVVLPYKLTDSATFNLGAQYSANNLDNVEDDDFLWFTAGVTVGF
jgi:uncharacterized protein (TIGR02001 family)